MKMFRNLVVLAAAAPLLAACNASAPAPRASLAASTSASAPADVASKPALPSGTACADAINRYDTVVTSDVETGNVNKPVYESIQRDLAPARSACIAGRGGEAVGLVSASRRRHGYPG